MGRILSRLAGCVLANLLAGPALADPQLLYDVDFASPPHVVGAEVTEGAGPPPRDTVSAGNAIVLESHPHFPDQPVLFNSYDGYRYIWLELDDLPACDLYTFSTRLVVDEIEAHLGGLTILFDTPQVRNVHFMYLNTYGYRAISWVPSGGSVSLANFVPGTPMELDVEIDLAADQWRIHLDGALVDSRSFGGAVDLRTIRFSTGTSTPDSITVLDDVEVAGAYCAPRPPGEVVDLLVNGYDRATGNVSLSYSPACLATDNKIVFGPLENVASYDYSGRVCGIGNTGPIRDVRPG